MRLLSINRINLYLILIVSVTLAALKIGDFGFKEEKAKNVYQPRIPQVPSISQSAKKSGDTLITSAENTRHIAPPSRERHAPPPMPNKLLKHSSVNREHISEFGNLPQDLRYLDRASLTQIIASSNDIELVHHAAWLLGNSLTLSQDEFATLLQRLESADPSMEKFRKTLLWVMSLRADLLPVTRIADIAANDPSPIVRRGALRSLTTRKGGEIDRVIQKVALTDENKHNRIEALYFASLSKSSVLDLATSEQAMMAESDPSVRRSWLAFLGNRYGQVAQDVLYQTMRSQSEDMEIRILAAQLLVNSGEKHLFDLRRDPLLPDEIKNNLRPNNSSDL